MSHSPASDRADRAAVRRDRLPAAGQVTLGGSCVLLGLSEKTWGASPVWFLENAARHGSAPFDATTQVLAVAATTIASARRAEAL